MSLLSMLEGEGTTATCSSTGCTAAAQHAIHWRNPRIHGADRVKTWAACSDHRDTLSQWLRSRAFPVAVTGFGETVERVV